MLLFLIYVLLFVPCTVIGVCIFLPKIMTIPTVIRSQALPPESLLIESDIDSEGSSTLSEGDSEVSNRVHTATTNSLQP